MPERAQLTEDRSSRSCERARDPEQEGKGGGGLYSLKGWWKWRTRGEERESSKCFYFLNEVSRR